MSEISSEISKKYDELRNIGQELATLVGRDPKFLPRKRVSTADEPPPARRDNDRKISYENGERSAKRSRLIEDEPSRRRDSDRRDEEPYRKPTVQSSVRMATIETKSRDQILAERRNKAGNGDGARRMFGNLLLGTLQKFQKEEKVVPAVKAQTEKLREVEERLEKSQREEKEKFIQDRKAVEMKMREKEMEIKRLKQKQAIQVKNEAKLTHYKRLQNFIQTETKPPIFFLPARMSIRSVELLKSSSRNLETLIKERQDDMENELRELDELSDGEIRPAIRSSVKVVSTDQKDSHSHLKPTKINGSDNIDDGIDDVDDDDDDENDVFRVRSAVVVKSEVKALDKKDDKSKLDETKKGSKGGESQEESDAESGKEEGKKDNDSAKDEENDKSKVSA